MSNEEGPWGAQGAEPDATPDPEAARGRPWLWWLFIAAVVGVVIAMVRAFPEAVRKPDDWTDLAYGLGLVVVVTAGISRIRRDAIAQHLRYAAIWAAIVAVVALGFAYRAEFADVGAHLKIAFSGGSPVATGEHEMVIPQDESGAYVVIAKVNGQRVLFMVDTGATDTVLSPDDARRIGVNVEALHFDREAETANGLGYGAHYAADSLEVGAIRLDSFKMTVNKAPMSTSLLGMSFLNQLESFQFGRGKLTLKWRDRTE
jgi:aspartyl protease family protein